MRNALFFPCPLGGGANARNALFKVQTRGTLSSSLPQPLAPPAVVFSPGLWPGVQTRGMLYFSPASGRGCKREERFVLPRLRPLYFIIRYSLPVPMLSVGVRYSIFPLCFVLHRLRSLSSVFPTQNSTLKTQNSSPPSSPGFIGRTPWASITSSILTDRLIHQICSCISRIASRWLLFHHELLCQHPMDYYTIFRCT